METGILMGIRDSMLSGLPLKSLLMSGIRMVGSFGVGRLSWVIIDGVIRVSNLLNTLRLILPGY